MNRMYSSQIIMPKIAGPPTGAPLTRKPDVCSVSTMRSATASSDRPAEQHAEEHRPARPQHLAEREVEDARRRTQERPGVAGARADRLAS